MYSIVCCWTLFQYYAYIQKNSKNNFFNKDNNRKCFISLEKLANWLEMNFLYEILSLIMKWWVIDEICNKIFVIWSQFWILNF